MPPNCSDCGLPIKPHEEIVTQAGIEPDLTLDFHARCFAIRERRLKREGTIVNCIPTPSKPREYGT